MRMALTFLALVLSVAMLAGCGGGGSGDSNPTQTYTASLTDMQILRTADQQALTVNSLPAAGAQITVR
jgi:ABC-type glycerol-3-phosphate transport system substrate-binding protein